MPIFRILHSAGCSNDVDLPDDLPVKEMIPELIRTLALPWVAQDGQSLEYCIDSKSLGRRLLEEETVASANIPVDDTLILTLTLLAGDVQLFQKKSSTESAIGIKLDHLTPVEVANLVKNETAITMTLYHYLDTLKQLDDLRLKSKETESERDGLKDSLKEKNIATLGFVLSQILTGFGINLITNNSTGGWLVFLSGIFCSVFALFFCFFGKRVTKSV